MLANASIIRILRISILAVSPLPPVLPVHFIFASSERLQVFGGRIANGGDDPFFASLINSRSKLAW